MDPIRRLPPDWKLTAVTTALSETQDWSLDFLGIPPLWKQTQGEGLTIAVLDTGVDEKHPDLQGAIKGAKDFSGSPFGASDRAGHGSWCAGMIGARAGNNIGVRGIMSKCQLLCGKVLGDNGAGYDQWIAEGVKWAMAQGADMISLSLGGPQMSDGLRQIFQSFVSQKGRFIFAAAGNDGPGSPPDYPGAWPECIAVAAVDKQGKVTDFSSRGPHVAIAAPGYEMLSTIPGGRYGIMSGTSMACPLACAVAGLAVSKHRKSGSTTPLDTVQDLRDHLKKTAIPKGDSDAYGYGLIDPAALLADVDSLPPATQPPSPVAGGIWVWIPGGKTVGTF